MQSDLIVNLIDGIDMPLYNHIHEGSEIPYRALNNNTAQ